MRGIKLKTGKRKTTIPRWRIRAAVRAAYLEEILKIEAKNKAIKARKKKVK